MGGSEVIRGVPLSGILGSWASLLLSLGIYMALLYTSAIV